MKVILVSKNLSKTSNLGIGPPYTTNSQKFFLHLWERGKKFLFWIAETQCVYLLSCWGEEGKGLGFTIFHHIQDTIKCVNPTIILWSIKNERKTIPLKKKSGLGSFIDRNSPDQKLNLHKTS